MRYKVEFCLHVELAWTLVEIVDGIVLVIPVLIADNVRVDPAYGKDSKHKRVGKTF